MMKAKFPFFLGIFLICLNTAFAERVLLTIKDAKTQKNLVTEVIDLHFSDLPTNDVVTPEILKKANLLARQYSLGNDVFSFSAYRDYRIQKYNSKSKELEQVTVKTGYDVINLVLQDKKHNQLDRTDFIYFRDKKLNFISTDLNNNKSHENNKYTVELRPLSI